MVVTGGVFDKCLLWGIWRSQPMTLWHTLHAYDVSPTTICNLHVYMCVADDNRYYHSSDTYPNSLNERNYSHILLYLAFLIHLTQASCLNHLPKHRVSPSLPWTDQPLNQVLSIVMYSKQRALGRVIIALISLILLVVLPLLQRLNIIKNVPYR